MTRQSNELCGGILSKYWKCLTNLIEVIVYVVHYNKSKSKKMVQNFELSCNQNHNGLTLLEKTQADAVF